jgi:hypothetical protein
MAAETDTNKIIESLGLTPDAIRSSGGRSVFTNMKAIILKLRDATLNLEAKKAIANAVVSWQTIAPKQMVEDTLQTQCNNILTFVFEMIQKADQTRSADLTVPAVIIAAGIRKQVQSASSSMFARQLRPHLLKFLNDVARSGMNLKEDGPNAKDAIANQKTEIIKLIFESVSQTVDPTLPDALPEVIPVFLDLLKVFDAKNTPSLYSENLKWLTTAGSSSPRSFDNSIGGLVDAMRFFGAEDLAFILRFNKRAFVDVAPHVLETNLAYLLTAVGLVDLVDGVVAVADRNPIALSNVVGDLVREIPTSRMKPQLLYVLLKIAIVKPSAVSPYANDCVQTCEIDPGLMVPLCKLLAATARAGVRETYASLTALCNILRSGQAVLPQQQMALLGAIDVAKDLSPKSDIFHEDTLGAMKSISSADPETYKNIVRWNKGNWALTGEIEEYIKHVDSGGADRYGAQEEGDAAYLLAAPAASGVIGSFLRAVGLRSSAPVAANRQPLQNPNSNRANNNIQANEAPVAPPRAPNQITPGQVPASSGGGLDALEAGDQTGGAGMGARRRPSARVAPIPEESSSVPSTAQPVQASAVGSERIAAPVPAPVPAPGPSASASAAPATINTVTATVTPVKPADESSLTPAKEPPVAGATGVSSFGTRVGGGGDVPATTTTAPAPTQISFTTPAKAAAAPAPVPVEAGVAPLPNPPSSQAAAAPITMSTPVAPSSLPPLTDSNDPELLNLRNRIAMLEAQLQ